MTLVNARINIFEFNKRVHYGVIKNNTGYLLQNNLTISKKTKSILSPPCELTSH